jgi:hypothetical protein
MSADQTQQAQSNRALLYEPFGPRVVLANECADGPALGQQLGDDRTTGLTSCAGYQDLRFVYMGFLPRRFTPSPSRSHLWRLFPDLSGVDDELERVRILMLLHELEINKPSDVSYGSTGLEPVSGPFKQ